MLTRIARQAFFTGLIIALTSGSMRGADEPSEPTRSPYYGVGASSFIFLITKPGVHKELGLGEPEFKELLESLREIDPKHAAFRTPEEQQRVRAMNDETQRQSEAAIEKALSKEQFRRFQQLEMQRLGGRAILLPDTAQKLALTAEQQETLEKIKEQFRRSGQASRNVVAAGAPVPNAEEVAARLERYNADLSAVLTPAQSNQFKEMSGAPFKFPAAYGGLRRVLAPEVQKELGLSEEDAATLAQSLTAIQREGYANVARRFEERPSQADQRRQFEMILDTVRSSLTIAQWNRLQELQLQELGIESLQQYGDQDIRLLRDVSNSFNKSGMTFDFRMVRNRAGLIDQGNRGIV